MSPEVARIRARLALVAEAERALSPLSSAFVQPFLRYLSSKPAWTELEAFLQAYPQSHVATYTSGARPQIQELVAALRRMMAQVERMDSEEGRRVEELWQALSMAEKLNRSRRQAAEVRRG